MRGRQCNVGPWTREGQQFSRIGLAITAATVPVMYVLARRKIVIARKIGSRALRADAMESNTCGWLSFVVLGGILAQLALGSGGSIPSPRSPSYMS